MLEVECPTCGHDWNPLIGLLHATRITCEHEDDDGTEAEEDETRFVLTEWQERVKDALYARLIEIGLSSRLATTVQLVDDVRTNTRSPAVASVSSLGRFDRLVERYRWRSNKSIVCPSCGNENASMKSDGCGALFCVKCLAAFDWKTRDPVPGHDVSMLEHGAGNASYRQSRKFLSLPRRLRLPKIKQACFSMGTAHMRSSIESRNICARETRNILVAAVARADDLTLAGTQTEIERMIGWFPFAYALSMRVPEKISGSSNCRYSLASAMIDPTDEMSCVNRVKRAAYVRKILLEHDAKMRSIQLAFASDVSKLLDRFADDAAHTPQPAPYDRFCKEYDRVRRIANALEHRVSVFYSKM